MLTFFKLQLAATRSEIVNAAAAGLDGYIGFLADGIAIYGLDGQAFAVATRRGWMKSARGPQPSKQEQNPFDPVVLYDGNVSRKLRPAEAERIGCLGVRKRMAPTARFFRAAGRALSGSEARD